MPKFGWKCFIGSFLFSLAAVFAATKVYLLLPVAQQNKTEAPNFDNIETKDINLFADTEENNPIIEKFNELNNSSTAASLSKASDDRPQTASEIEIAQSETAPETDDTVQITSGVLYEPDEPENEAAAPSFQAVADIAQNDIEKTVATDNSDITDNNTDNNNEEETANADNEEVLKIADASEAPIFMIPIKHNFTVQNKEVKISNEAENSQVALASNNVRVQNLGTENKIASASIDNSAVDETEKEAEPYSDPWVVATAGNDHITKNKLEAASSVEKNVAALDLQKPEPAKSDNEKKVAYKMVKNILIPIPEDIANDENLTPQLSYSEENKKLSEKLRQSGELGDTAAKDDEKPDKPETTPLPKQETPKADENAENSTSLTDSISAWFSSSKNKTDDKSTNNDTKTKSGDSAFSKLLGLGRKDNSSIAPSELKLSFQVNRAEISGQTLEWLKAFSDNAVKNDDVFVEIRIDGSGSYELQQKRLNLLYSILVNNGVDYNKINIIFTEREPNSFIIRNVRYASEEDANKARKKAYNPWY